MVVIYGYYFLILPLNSNILLYMSNTNYTTNQDIMLLLAKRIKEYRLAARMSQKEMAEKSGVSLRFHFPKGDNYSEKEFESQGWFF
jgi:hypothetical protein